MRKWECTTRHELEKPWTDSENGCEYYNPVRIVIAQTRGKAKAIFADEFADDVHFCDVLARVYRGDSDPDLPYDAYDLTDKPVKNVTVGDGWIIYETQL